jgi:hypothetical protein
VAAVDVVNDYLQELPGCARRLAHGEWGLTIAAETLGEPLDASRTPPVPSRWATAALAA